jgi:GntR family transcriptional regulator, rspAB operon transcriptional repressor
MSVSVRANLLDRSRQVASQIQEILSKRILSVQLVPGTVLSRMSLQAEFGVSQTPVRDALMRLQEDGLVEIFPQYATVVTRIDIDHARQAQFLRLSIELEAIRRLTLDTPKETADELSAIVAKQTEAASPETYDVFDELDREFHRIIYRRASVMELWATVRRQSVHIDRLRRLHLPMPGKLQNVLENHREISDAVRAGNPQVAADALRQHLSGTLSRVDMISEKFPDFIRLE